MPELNSDMLSEIYSILRNDVTNPNSIRKLLLSSKEATEHHFNFTKRVSAVRINGASLEFSSVCLTYNIVYICTYTNLNFQIVMIEI